MKTDKQEFDGHRCRDDHPTSAVDGEAHVATLSKGVLPPQLISDGQCKTDIHQKDAVAGGDVVGHCSSDTQSSCADTIATIRELWRQRVDLHREEKSLTLRMKAICRRCCGGDKANAAALYKSVFSKGEHALTAMALGLCAPFIEAHNVIKNARMAAETSLEKLAGTLPIASWWTAIRGAGLLGLAALVAETGDIGNYANPAKIWKRMGLAVMGDTRQRRMKDKKAAEEHGYSPARRSVVWTIGDTLFKHQSARVEKETGEVLREAGPYRVIYDEYKARDSANHPDITKAHLHNRAKRYMEKRLLKHIWRAWRQSEARRESTPTDGMLGVAA